MNLLIPPELQRFIHAKVKSGAYGSAEQVVSDALVRWKSEEERDGAELRRLVAEGQGEADRGELVDAGTVFAEIEAKSRQRRKV